MNDTRSATAESFAPDIAAIVARFAEQQCTLLAPIERRWAGRPGEIEAILALARELLYEDEVRPDAGWPHAP